LINLVDTLPSATVKLMCGRAPTSIIREFTGGDPSIQRGLNAMFADQKNWPQPQKQSFRIRPEIKNFIRRAIEAA
jgi:hypothetical protein